MVCTRSKTKTGLDRGIVITRPLFVEKDVIDSYINLEKDANASEAIKLKNEKDSLPITSVEVFYHDHTSGTNAIKQETIFPKSPDQNAVYTFHQLDSIGITVDGQTRFLKGVDSLIKAYALSGADSKCDTVVINSKNFKQGAVTFSIDAIYKLILFAQGAAASNAEAANFLKIYGNFVFMAADQVARVFKETKTGRSLLGESKVVPKFITSSICGLNNFVSIVAAARMEYETKEQELQMKIKAHAAKLAASTSAPATSAPTTSAPATSAPTTTGPTSQGSMSADESVGSAKGNVSGDTCSSSKLRRKICNASSSQPAPAASGTQAKKMKTITTPNVSAARAPNVASALENDLKRENVSQYISWAKWQAEQVLPNKPFHEMNDQEKTLQLLVYEYDVKSYIQRYYAGWLMPCEKTKQTIADYLAKAAQIPVQGTTNEYVKQLNKIQAQIQTQTQAKSQAQAPFTDDLPQIGIEDYEHMVNHAVLATNELMCIQSEQAEQAYTSLDNLLDHISGKAIYSNVDKGMREFSEFKSIITDLNKKGVEIFKNPGTSISIDAHTIQTLNELAKQVFSYMAVDKPLGSAGGSAAVTKKIKVLGRLRTIFLKRGYQYVTVNKEPMLVSAAVKMEKKLAKALAKKRT